MSARTALLLALLSGASLGLAAGPARADQPAGSPAPPSTPSEPSATPAAPPSAPVAAAAAGEEFQGDNRLILSADGESLTGTNGGEGGSVNYLGQPSANALLGVGAEYQRLAGANWEFASFTGSYGNQITADSRWSVHAEAHEGTGRSSSALGSSTFDYSIVAAGGGLTAPGGLSFDLEERQIDVQTSHGSLPKATLAQPFGKHLLTTLSYAHSFGGNLDTSYGLARLDVLAPGYSVIAGGSLGRVTPAVINIQGLLLTESRHLSEVFLGVTKTIAHVDLTLLGDDQDLEGIKRVTLTLNLTVHLR
jgi:hypothetical protein